MAHTGKHGYTRAVHTGKSNMQMLCNKSYMTLHTVNTGNIKNIYKKIHVYG